MIARFLLRATRFALVAMFCGASLANAALFRAYVSSIGNDANPCTVQQPCRLLPAALAAVSDGGEIWMLDSANYNTATVTVDKSVTILAVPGAVGSVVATGGGAAIGVNGTNVEVTLRNLVIVPFGDSFTNGIEFLDGFRLVVEHCTITGHLVDGILINAPMGTLGTDVLIKDTHISGANDGIEVSGLGGELVRLSVVDTTIDGVISGMIAHAGIEFTMNNSQVVGRGLGSSASGFEFHSDAGHSPVEAHIAKSVIRDFSDGVLSTQTVAFSSVSIADSELSHNDTAVQASGGGTIALTGNRLVHNSFAVIADPGPVFTSGTNYFAYNANNGAALTGPAGLQ